MARVLHSRTHHTQHPGPSGKNQKQKPIKIHTPRSMSMPVRDASDNHVQKEQGRGNLWGNTPTPVSNHIPQSQPRWSQRRREISQRDLFLLLSH